MTAYRRDDDVAEVRGPDRVTLLLVREPHRSPVALTGSGIAVWEELGHEPRELREIVATVSRRFGATESLIEADVERLCRQLAHAELLVPGEHDEGGAAR